MLMKHCLFCHEERILSTTWGSLFLPAKPVLLCDDCRELLSMIPEETCPRCSRPKVKALCSDCRWWEVHYQNKDPLSASVSIFMYNDFAQEIIANWKYRGDYILIEAFKHYFREAFKQNFQDLKDPIIVPIPLSEGRKRERRFNQAEQLASFLPGEKQNPLRRITSEKQAKKSRDDRIYSENPFILERKVKRPVILVDDIYTTGSTLRQAAHLLRDSHCPEVYGYTLIRG